jgi:hypothetical protein
MLTESHFGGGAGLHPSFEDVNSFNTIPLIVNLWFLNYFKRRD